MDIPDVIMQVKKFTINWEQASVYSSDVSSLCVTYIIIIEYKCFYITIKR